MLGLIGELYFDNVRIPDDMIVGQDLAVLADNNAGAEAALVVSGRRFAEEAVEKILYGIIRTGA